MWDKEKITSSLARLTQFPSGSVVREWYNDYAIFLSTYSKEITANSEEDEFFTLCASFVGFSLPYERLKGWLQEHHQDTSLADELFSGLMAQLSIQESVQSDNEFCDSALSKPANTTHSSSSNNNNSSKPASASRHNLTPFEIKHFIDSTLYFLDRENRGF